LKSEHNLWRPIPPRSDILGHKPGIILCRVCAPSESKVTDLEIAVCVEEEIGGFEIAVEDVGGVHCLESAEGLVDKVLAVVVGEVLGSDDAVHVCFHEFLDEVDFCEGVEAAWFLDIEDRDDLSS
jgi:hypothetical protein